MLWCGRADIAPVRSRLRASVAHELCYTSVRILVPSANMRRIVYMVSSEVEWWIFWIGHSSQTYRYSFRCTARGKLKAWESPHGIESDVQIHMIWYTSAVFRARIKLIRIGKRWFNARSDIEVGKNVFSLYIYTSQTRHQSNVDICESCPIADIIRAYRWRSFDYWNMSLLRSRLRWSACSACSHSMLLGCNDVRAFVGHRFVCVCASTDSLRAWPC